MAEKRQNEEALQTIGEWCRAKSHFLENISQKQERTLFISEPSKIAVLTKEFLSSMDYKAQVVFESEEDFLKSEEESLNTTFDEAKEAAEKAEEKEEAAKE